MIANQDSNVYSANLVHVFSPTLTNEFVFADAKFLNPIILANPAAVDPGKLGFQMTGLFPTDPVTHRRSRTCLAGKASPDTSGYTYGDKGFPAGFGKSLRHAEHFGQRE